MFRSAPIGLRRIVVACLTLFFSFALAGPVSGQEEKIVREIRFEGLESIPPVRLKQQIRTREGEPFSRQTLDEDIRRLHELGEFKPNIWATYVVNDETDDVTVIFHLREREVIENVSFVGMEEFSVGDLEKDPRFPLIKPGDLLEPGLTERIQKRIREAYIKEGYVFVEVRVEEARPEKRRVELTFRVIEGPRAVVDDIRFLGNAHISGSDLSDHMKTKPATWLRLFSSGTFTEETLDQDVERLQTLYRQRGYLDARVFVEEIAISDDWEEIVPVIRVIEGPLYHVRKIQIRGTRLFEEDELIEKMDLQPDQPFSGEKLRNDFERIRSLYTERAYIEMRIKPDLRYLLETNEVDLTLSIEEGEKIYVEKVEIVGNTKTRDDVIRREVSLYPGELFNTKLLDESRLRLGRRGYFANTYVDIQPASRPGRRNLVLEVEEQPTGTILFGGGISSDAGFFGRISITQPNFDITDLPKSLDDFLSGTAFVGGGQRLDIQLEPGRTQSRYLFRFAEPYLFGYPYIGTVGYTFFERDRGDYAEQRHIGNFGLGYRFDRDTLLELEYTGQDVNIFDIELDAVSDIVEVAGHTFVSSAKLQFSIDLNEYERNRLQSGGWAFQAFYELASEAFGSDINFNRFSLKGNWQETLFELPNNGKHVFGVAGSFSWQEPYGKTKSIPLFERFFAGGPRSIRGFEFRSVTPQKNDEPVGGNALAYVNAEYNFPFPYIGDYVRGVVFLDWGTVEAEISDFDFGEFRTSVGTGLRLHIGLFPAPVALDFGWPIQMQDDDDRQVFSFFFDVGYQF